MNIYIIFGLLILYAVSEIFHRRERKSLLNRIMSKDYGEYKYFVDKYPKDLKEVERIRKEVRKQPANEIDFSKNPEDEKAYEKFVKGLEEEWSEDEIDKSKIKRE